MFTANPIPSKITANRQESYLFVAWTDGHESRIPFSLLRAGCPCVTCRGGHDKMSADPDPEVFFTAVADSDSVRVAKVELVGNYALTVEWQDGHHYGIYHWYYLRALCPCEGCRPAGVG